MLFRSASELEHLFSPFYQVESPIIRKHPGVGLGLAIAKGIIEQHGGAISVESQVGEGSTFTLVLPALDGKIAAIEGKPKEGKQ